MKTPSFARLLAAVVIGVWMPEPSHGGVAVSNDDFSAATVISGATGTTTGDTTGATQEVDEPEFLKSNGNGKSIWWRWTAPETGRFVFDTVGTGKDTILGVYTGTTLVDLAAEAEADQGVPNSNESRVVFSATAGTEYFVAVDVWAEEDVGSVTLNWAPFVPPALTAPVMVYSLRTVSTFQGFMGQADPDPLFAPRTTSISTALVVRGRSNDAIVAEDQLEVGPVAVVQFYTLRVGRGLEKYYSVVKGMPDPDNPVSFLQQGMSTSLVRVSRASTGVFETAGIQGERDGSQWWVNGLLGRATLTKINPSQATPLWFARRLTAMSESSLPGFDQLFAAQGQPILGIYSKDSHTLTFNATETNAVSGQSFSDALATVLQRLQAKGYQPEDDTIDVP